MSWYSNSTLCSSRPSDATSAALSFTFGSIRASAALPTSGLSPDAPRSRAPLSASSSWPTRAAGPADAPESPAGSGGTGTLKRGANALVEAAGRGLHTRPGSRRRAGRRAATRRP